MITAGVDIGSTACKAVVLRDGKVAGRAISPSTAAPAQTSEGILAEALEAAGTTRAEVAYIVGTGYGRALVPFADDNISELSCHGKGARFAAPAARTVLDIGGQDTKAIRIDADGFLIDYAMNDKCAAGTGRFLDAMARALGLRFEQMDELAKSELAPCVITSMCSVFAESEVINLINEGVPAERIVKGLNASMAGRVAALARRVGVEDELIITGGVAKSQGVRKALAEKMGTSAKTLDLNIDPQLIGALGAAVLAQERAEEK